jgi:steroid delta-isomerase-like uncharacterized protein
MTTNLAIYADTLNQAWNSHDIEKVLGFYSPDYIADDVGLDSLLRGHGGLREMLQTYWRAFPDLEIAVTDMVIEGSRVATAWVAAGTHQGTIMNIPPPKQTKCFEAWNCKDD